MTDHDDRPETPERELGVRFLARWVDTTVYGAALVAFVVALCLVASIAQIDVGPGGENGASLQYQIYVLSYLLGFSAFAAVSEALLLCTWGTTPGKALLRCRVRWRDGTKLSFKLALQRSLFVQVFGMGLNTLVITVIAHWKAYQRHERHGSFYWDSVTGSCVLSEEPGDSRIMLAVGLLGSALLLGILLASL